MIALPIWSDVIVQYQIVPYSHFAIVRVVVMRKMRRESDRIPGVGEIDPPAHNAWGPQRFPLIAYPCGNRGEPEWRPDGDKVINPQIGIRSRPDENPAWRRVRGVGGPSSDPRKSSVPADATAS